MFDLWNRMGMSEVEEQDLACRIRSILKNKILIDIEIRQLRKKFEKDEIVSDRADTVLEISYGVSSGTETVKEQYCDLKDYPRDTPEDHIEDSIHQCLIEIMHDGAKGGIPNLRSRDITLVTKYVNEVNKVLKCIPVRNLSESSMLREQVHYWFVKKFLSKQITP